MDDKTENQLLQYLPEVYRQDPATRDFLLAFEKILLGHADDAITQASIEDSETLKNLRGLEQILDDLARHFTPGTDETDGAPNEFLPWLSQWVALSLRWDVTLDAEINNAIRRSFIARMAQLYRDRGTKKGMKELLAVFTKTSPAEVTIDDQIPGEPYFFRVLINLEAIKNGDSLKDFERTLELAHSVIRLEKPAHTRYQLVPDITTFRIGQRKEPPPAPDNVTIPTDYNIIIGKNTRLGFARWKKNT